MKIKMQLIHLTPIGYNSYKVLVVNGTSSYTELNCAWAGVSMRFHKSLDPSKVWVQVHKHEYGEDV